MRLVILTNHYPYSGEPFLVDEMKIAEKMFDEILVVTTERDTNKGLDYLPKNARTVAVRNNINTFTRLISVVPALLSTHFWNELLIVSQKTSFTKKEILKSLLVHESEIFFLKKAKHVINEFIEYDEIAVFYSYWLTGLATYIARHVSNRHIKVSRTHGGDCFFNREYHPYRAYQIENMDLICPISEAGRIDLIQHNKTCANIEKKIQTARLGILLNGTENNPWEKKRNKTIVTCSNIIPLKRLDLMIDALTLINDLQLNWIHFGDGTEMDKVKKQATHLIGCKNNISFIFKGRVPQKYILDYYRSNSVDLFINCSDAEGIPVSAMEAMCFGIPVICRNVGGNSELVDDTCGMLLSKDISAEDLATAIRSFLLVENTRIIQEKRNNAKSRINELYSAKKNFESFYNEAKRISK